MKKTYLYFGNSLPKMVSRRFPGTSRFGSAAYKTDAELAAEKKLKDEKAITDKETELKALKIEKPEDFTKAFQLYKEIAELKGKNLDEKLAAIEEAQKQIKEAKPEVTAEEHKKVVDRLETTIRALDIVQARVKNQGTTPQPQAEKSFNQILADTIERYADQIKGFTKGSAPLTMDMMPEVKAGPDGKREVKTVGDMSVSANFSTAGEFTTDRRTLANLIETPYNRVWLADVLLQGSSTGSSILYPKENGGEGAAALWTDPTADKPQIDYDFTTQSAYFKWIAGILIIGREMLDDISFLQSYIQSKLLISLKTAENSFILNGSSDTNPVSGMLDVATVYDGSYTNDVDRIIDSGWGQIVEDTHDFYNPTHVILHPRDSVKVMLNKAGGSGEYDLPNNSVSVSNSGVLSISGIQVVRTTQVTKGDFLTFDKNAVMFIRRMQPELRMFEDAALAKKNKIMFRVEERATLAIFNNTALVTGGTGS